MSLHCSSLFLKSVTLKPKYTHKSSNFLCTYQSSSNWKRHFRHSIVLVCWSYQHQQNTVSMKHSHTINLPHNKPTPTYSATSEIWTQFTVLSAKKRWTFCTMKPSLALTMIKLYWTHVASEWSRKPGNTMCKCPPSPKIKICPPVLYEHKKYKKIDLYCQAPNCYPQI